MSRHHAAEGPPDRDRAAPTPARPPRTGFDGERLVLAAAALVAPFVWLTGPHPLAAVGMLVLAAVAATRLVTGVVPSLDAGGAARGGLAAFLAGPVALVLLLCVLATVPALTRHVRVDATVLVLDLVLLGAALVRPGDPGRQFSSTARGPGGLVLLVAGLIAVVAVIPGWANSTVGVQAPSRPGSGLSLQTPVVSPQPTDGLVTVEVTATGVSHGQAWGLVLDDDGTPVGATQVVRVDHGYVISFRVPSSGNCRTPFSVTASADETHSGLRVGGMLGDVGQPSCPAATTGEEAGAGTDGDVGQRVAHATSTVPPAFGEPAGWPDVPVGSVAAGPSGLSPSWPSTAPVATRDVSLFSEGSPW